MRALSRNPDKHRELADEVVKADLNRPETLRAAFEGAHGVFLVTNFWEEGTDELKQATAAVRAAKDAGVKHFIWSTLPDVEAISDGKFNVPHFTGKAKIDRIVKEAGFANHTFVIAPFYYQNLVGALAPQKQADGSVGWALPLDPDCAGHSHGRHHANSAISWPAHSHIRIEAGNGEYLPLVGDFVSFNEIIGTLNRQGHDFTFRQVPDDDFASAISGRRRGRGTFRYFEAHTYLGSDQSHAITLANTIAGRQPTPFASWARKNFALLPGDRTGMRTSAGAEA